jgi:hypothetical protein
MPWFYFDLMVHGAAKSQGSMILEDAAGARERADSLARELRRAKPELEGKDCFVLVTDESAQELYRSPLDETAISRRG